MQDTLVEAERWLLEYFVQPGTDVPSVVLKDFEKLDTAVQESYFRDLAQRSGMLLFVTREEVRLVQERRQGGRDRPEAAAGVPGGPPAGAQTAHHGHRLLDFPGHGAGRFRRLLRLLVSLRLPGPAIPMTHRLATSRPPCSRPGPRCCRAPATPARGSGRWGSRSRCRPWPGCARAGSARLQRLYFSVSTRRPVQSGGGGSFWKPMQSS